MGNPCSAHNGKMTENIKTVKNSDYTVPITVPASLQDGENIAAKISEIARAAGAVALEIYKKNTEHVSVQMKGDEHGFLSPVTEADQAATTVICSMLQKFDKDIPIVIEEKKLEDYETRKNYEFWWCCDPLDGTKEFLKKNGQFTVNIGLIHRSTPVFGVVYVPTSDVIYYGGTLGNYGSWKLTSKEGRAEGIQAATFSRTDENLTIVASRSHSNKATQDFINEFKKPTLKSMGSSLKLLLVAEGSAHCYPRLAPTREWDTAAAHAIVNAAGGCVLIADLIYEVYENGKPRGLIENPDGGKPLYYNKVSNLNPYFVVWGKLKK